MSLIQLLKFKKWETRLFKMPRFETPCFQTGPRVTVASGLFHEEVRIEMRKVFGLPDLKRFFSII